MPIVDGSGLSFSILSQSLPSGLRFNVNTGRIYGTPLTPSPPRTIAFSVRNAFGSRNTSVSLSVPSPLSGAFYTSKYQLLLVNQTITAIVPDPYCSECTYSAIGRLPDGILLDPATGIISGASTQMINNGWDCSIRRSNGCSSNTDSIRLTVRGIPSISYASSYILALRESVSIQPAREYATYVSIASGLLPSGLSLNSQTGAVTGSPALVVESSSVTFRAFNDAGNTTRTVLFRVLERIAVFNYNPSNQILAVNSSVSLSPQITGSCNDYSIVSGSLPVGLSLNVTTGAISGIPSQLIRNQQVTIRAQNGLGSMNATLTFTVFLPIASFSYPFNQYILEKKKPVSLSPSIVGDSVTYSLTSGSLPSGLTLSAATGVISGVPSTSILTFKPITVTAANVAGTKSFSLQMKVLVKPTLSYSESEYMVAVGDSLTLIPTVRGDLIQYSVQGILPKGLQLNPDTGVISGRAEESFNQQSVPIVASNEVGSVSCRLSICVLTKISDYSYSETSFTLMKGKRYSLSPSFHGDSVAFSIQMGSLPKGLVFINSTGVIQGATSDIYSKSTVIIQARNALSSATATLTITSYSLPFLILVSVVVLLFIILSVLYYVRWKKSQLPVRRMEDVKKSIVKPTVRHSVKPVSEVVAPRPILPVQPVEQSVSVAVGELKEQPVAVGELKEQSVAVGELYDQPITIAKTEAQPESINTTTAIPSIIV